MKNKILFCIVMLCSFYSVSISQQTITSIINYESGWQGNLNHTTCNIFNISPFSIISGATHYPMSGGAIRASSSPLILKAQGDPTNRSSVVAGVAYAFGYPIKAGFTYNVSANVFRTKVTGGSSTAATNFEIGTTATLPNPNQAGTLPTACSMVSYSNLTAVLPFKRGGTAIGNSSAQNLNVVQNYTPTTNQSYFTVLAFGDLVSDAVNVNIKNITITETSPFSLTPSSLNVICGSSAQTFTVNNATNAPGTKSYNWNLGTSNNGWLYNNAPAPQTFTTTTNSINLAPASGATSLANVGVTVVLNGTPSTVLSSAITFSNPVFTVGGPNEICTSELYGIVGLPQGSSVNWSTSNSSVVSINSSGLATKVSGGNAFIAATVSLPSGCPNSVVPKTVRVGAAPPSGIVFENENPLCLGERYPRGVKVSSISNPVAGALYEWRVNNILRGSEENTINIIDSWCVNGTNTVSARAFLCNEWSTPFTISFEAEYCAPEGLRRFSISPNPASDMISVQSKSINTIKEIRVKDKLGNVKLIRKFTNGIKNGILEIGSLPPEIYFIEIFDGKVWYVEKIIKR